MPALEEALLEQLLPGDEADERGAVLEVRAGTGGDEAALFAGDLFRMYQRFSELRRWKFEVRRRPLEAHLWNTLYEPFSWVHLGLQLPAASKHGGFVIQQL